MLNRVLTFALIVFSYTFTYAQTARTIRVIDELRENWDPLFSSESSALIIQHIQITEADSIWNVLAIEVSSKDYVETGFSVSVFGSSGGASSQFAIDQSQMRELITQENTGYLVDCITAVMRAGEMMRRNQYYQIASIQLTNRVIMSYDQQNFYLTIDGTTAQMSKDQADSLYRVFKSVRDAEYTGYNEPDINDVGQ